LYRSQAGLEKFPAAYQQFLRKFS